MGVSDGRNWRVKTSVRVHTSFSVSLLTLNPSPIEDDGSATVTCCAMDGEELTVLRVFPREHRIADLRSMLEERSSSNELDLVLPDGRLLIGSEDALVLASVLNSH